MMIVKSRGGFLEARQMKSRTMLRVAGGSVAAMLVVGGISLVGPAQTMGNGPYEATVTRGEFGIPHVTAEDVPGVGFGYGYAFAQDNMCTLADIALTTGGERSRYLGPDGVADNGLDTASNLDSDVYYRAVNQSGKIPALLADSARLAPSAQAKALVTGYVAGVNQYLADTGVNALPDPTCRGKAWVRPITELDVWRNLHDVNQIGGTGALLSQIATARPPSGADTPTDLPATVRPPKVGSNAWGLGSEATRSGRGLLLGNPHFPWHGGKRFYQVRLTVPGTLDVSGGSVYGTPIVAIGHNRSLAWTHTVSTAQRFTMFQLQLVDGDPTSYLVDGKPEKMTTVELPIEVLAEDGGTVTVYRRLFTSRYGPLLSEGWTGTSAFAVRGANVNNLRDLDEWLGYGQADDVAGLEAVQRHYQSLPFLNTVASDERGTAYYADASVVPHVTDQHAVRCVDTPEGQAMYPKQTVLNGARSSCNWGSDADALEPGLFGPATMPRQRRSDYVGNSNDSPWLTNAHAPLTGYPRIFGDIADQRSPRDRSSHTIVADRLAGIDGLGEPGFDLAGLRAATFGNRVYSAELLRDGVVAMCAQNPILTASDGTTVDVGQACRVLGGWNLRADVDSRAAVLWHEFYSLAERADDLYLVPFDPANPVNTPNTLNQSSTEVRTALADAVVHLAEVGVPLDVPLGDVQRTRLVTGDIPVHGCAGSDGCFNVITMSAEHLGARGYGDVVHGTSFVFAVEFTDDGPRSATLMSYSQSANPESPHYSDQTHRYSRKEWVTWRGW